jgi:large subunit ribosomal protein L2
MPLKSFNPTSSGRRTMTVIDMSHLTRKEPEKRLIRGKKSSAGRDAYGHVSVRRRGGGHKRRLRFLDFNRSDKLGIPARVGALEYDPNRSAFIALLFYADGDKRYVLAPESLRVGDSVVCNDRTKVKVGNRMHIANIPVGYSIHDIELQVGRGGQIVRSAGTAAVLTSLDGPYAQVKLPSGEIRFVSKHCFATIGVVSNPDHKLISIGKAGRARWMGKRPRVLGKSMNPVSHPHGGGEGHTSIALKFKKTPWGKPAHGVKTRRRKSSDRWIAKERPRRRGRKRK